ncbi:hypothetical protein [Nannocystis pusilla]|uniref:hypothetical protein n=1 Tax=Nannocystis pusilla TaxID=889268 RepID=UPI003B774A49
MLTQALTTLAAAEVAQGQAAPGDLDRAHLQFALARALWSAQRSCRGRSSWGARR